MCVCVCVCVCACVRACVCGCACVHVCRGMVIITVISTTILSPISLFVRQGCQKGDNWGNLPCANGLYTH